MSRPPSSRDGPEETVGFPPVDQHCPLGKATTGAPGTAGPAAEQKRPRNHEDGVAALCGRLRLSGPLGSRLRPPGALGGLRSDRACVVLGLLATHGPVAVIQVNPHSSTVRTLGRGHPSSRPLRRCVPGQCPYRFAPPAVEPVRLLRSACPSPSRPAAATAALLFGGQRAGWPHWSAPSLPRRMPHWEPPS